MFKNVISSIGKLFGRREDTLDAKASHRASYHHRQANTPPLQDGDDPQQPENSLAALANKSAEELCGLRDGMSHEELESLLKMLYRRHNRAASSLDDNKRAEAEIMLDAIVEVRQRYLDTSGQ